MIHPTAVIDPTATIDETSTVWAYATIGPRVRIGADCVVGSNAYVGRDTQIGAGTRIQHGVFIPNNALIGDQVFIGPNVTMTDDKHPKAGNKNYDAKPPLIGDYVSIGAAAVILPGVVLEEGCVVGAGAVVTRRVPRYVTVAGNPAETTRTLQAWNILRDKISRMFEAALQEWDREPGPSGGNDRTVS